MKDKIPLLIFSLVLWLFSGCSNNKSDAESRKETEQQRISLLDSIKVGMTYDEVEKLLGKPFQIDRGANQLKMSSTKLTNDEMFYVMSFRDSLLQPRAWIQQMDVEEVGRLLYVSWVFLQTRKDTNFYFVPLYETRTDSVKQVKYFINGVEAKQWEYAYVGDTVYRDEMGKIIEAASWLKLKKNGVPGLRNPMPAQKETRVMYSTSSRRVRNGIRRVYCLTYSNFVVVFDASSGRVVISGYRPFSVKEIGAVL